MELDLKKIAILAEKVYNISIVANYFCKNHKEIWEIENIAPVLETIKNNADLIYLEFINAGFYDK